MGSARHDKETIAEFQSGETAIVYARWKDLPEQPPYYLVDGTASDPRVKALAVDMECFLPGCTDRRLRIINRHSSVRTARDGFSHYPGAGGHGTESLFHETAKETIRRWVLTHRPDLEVGVEVPLPVRERVADVMIKWPDGHRLAVEVQYSSLPVGDLEARTDSYRSAGIAVQWVFGHTGAHFRTWTDFDETTWVRFNDLQRAAANAGLGIVWLNPITPSLASPYVTRRPERIRGTWDTPPTADDDWVRVRVEDFGPQVILDAVTGFGSASLESWRQQDKWWREAVDRRDRDEAEALQRKVAAKEARRVEQLRRLREQHEQATKNPTPFRSERSWEPREPTRPRKPEVVRPRVARERVPWEQSPIRDVIEAEFGMSRPSHLTSAMQGDRSFTDSPLAWRSTLYVRFVLERRSKGSATISVTEAAMHLQEEGLARMDDLKGVQAAIRKYLAILVDLGEVEGPLYGGNEIYLVVSQNPARERKPR